MTLRKRTGAGLLSALAPPSRPWRPRPPRSCSPPPAAQAPAPAARPAPRPARRARRRRPGRPTSASTSPTTTPTSGPPTSTTRRSTPRSCTSSCSARCSPRQRRQPAEPADRGAGQPGRQGDHREPGDRDQPRPGDQLRGRAPRAADLRGHDRRRRQGLHGGARVQPALRPGRLRLHQLARSSRVTCSTSRAT